MDCRTRTFLSVFLLGTLLLGIGCGYTQHAKFQMSFLPPAPKAGVAAEGGTEIASPPEVALPNPYLSSLPGLLLANPLPPRAKLFGVAKVRQADQALQRGTRLYQRHEFDSARREFDAAIDLMLEAAGENPGDREDFENHLEEMVQTIHHYDLAGLGAAQVSDPDKFEKAPLEDILTMTFPVDPKLKDKVREQVTATVSQLPLTVTDAVLGYINYFSNRGHRTIVAATERSGRYRPMIQRILDEEGVPQELIHLAQAESGFIPRAMSRKAAGGMWQFLVWRGQEYGLKRTPYTDERMDPEKATRAAARHLHDLYNEFGDWYLAIAAYNCGPGTVEKAVERTGYADFWELRRIGVLPAETTNYVPIILAMTIMEKNARAYGLEGLQLDAPLEYDTVEMTAPTGLSLVSDILDTPQPELAALNPAIIKPIAPTGYALHVPKGDGNRLVAALEQVPADHRDAWRMHRVDAGDTLATIGKRYNVRPEGIVAANNLRSPEIMEGDRLLIPAAVRAVAAPVARRALTARTSPRRSSSGRPAVASRRPAAPARKTGGGAVTRASVR
jgi:membrane-bound lytic murein transglycosylase D